MNRALNSKAFSVLVGTFALWLSLSLINSSSQRDIVNREVKNIEAKIKEVRDDIDYLNKFLAYFQTSAFLEKEARLKLNYKTQGEEVVFVFKDKNAKKVSNSVSFEELLAKTPNYKKWFLYLLGY